MSRSSRPRAALITALLWAALGEPAGAQSWTSPARPAPPTAAVPLAAPVPLAPGTEALPLPHSVTWGSAQDPARRTEVTTTLIRPLQIPALPPAPGAAPAPASPAGAPVLEVLGAAQHYLMPGQDVTLRVVLRGTASQLRAMTHALQGQAPLTFGLRVMRPGQGATGRTLWSDADPNLGALQARAGAALRAAGVSDSSPIEAELSVSAMLAPDGEGSRLALRFAGTRTELGFAPRRGGATQASGTCSGGLERCARVENLSKAAVEVSPGDRVATLTCGARPEPGSPWDLVLRVPLPRDVRLDTVALWLPDPAVSLRYSADGVVWSEEPVRLPGGALLIGMDHPGTDQAGSTPCAAVSGLIELGAERLTGPLRRADGLIGPDPGAQR